MHVLSSPPCPRYKRSDYDLLLQFLSAFRDKNDVLTETRKGDEAISRYLQLKPVAHEILTRTGPVFLIDAVLQAHDRDVVTVVDAIDASELYRKSR